MSELIKKALYFSAISHDGQYRKGGQKVPYIVHPFEVAMLCMKYTDNEDVIVSALLHDVLEDCPEVNSDQVVNIFGNTIGDMVKNLTIDKTLKADNWREKKKNYINNISKLGEKELLIIGCDKIINMNSYFTAKLKGLDVDKFFKGSVYDYLWYYEEVGKVIESKKNNERMFSDYKNILYTYKKELNQFNTM